MTRPSNFLTLKGLKPTMRLTTTLSLSTATLVLAGLCAAAQPARTAAAVPAVGPAKASAPQGAAFSPAPAAKQEAAKPEAAPTTVATATPAPASAAPVEEAAPIPENHIDGIAATVGETSVSDFELDQRVKFFIATAGFKPNAEDLKRMRKIQLENLIDEHIQMAEARRRKITVSPVEVEKVIEDLVKRQNSTVKEFEDTLTKAGSSIEVLKTQQTVALAWRKVLGSEFADTLVVSPAMVDEALKRAAEGASKTHYHVVEIFLPVDGPTNSPKDAEVKKQIEDIRTQAATGKAPFRNLAQQYSRDPSAAAGGDMGWVYDGQLDPDLNAAVAKMKTNDLSEPIRGKGGWYLLGMIERQEPLGTNVASAEPVPTTPPGTLPLARLTIPMPRSTPPDDVKATMNVAMQIRAASTSCAAMEEISKDPKLKGTVFMNPLQFAKLVNPSATEGYIKLSDVSAEMQKALEGTKSGDAAMPFQSDLGIEIMVRCDKKEAPPRVAFTLPTKDDIEGEIFQEQMSANARRFMRDLRRNANIQQRDDNAVLDAALIQ